MAITNDRSRDRKDQSAWAKSSPSECLVDEKSMDSPISIIKGMNEKECKRDHRCGDHRIDWRRVYPAHHFRPGLHKGRHIAGLRSNETHELAVSTTCFTNENLCVAPVKGRISLIYDASLKLQQRSLTRR